MHDYKGRRENLTAQRNQAELAIYKIDGALALLKDMEAEYDANEKDIKEARKEARKKARNKRKANIRKQRKG